MKHIRLLTIFLTAVLIAALFVGISSSPALALDSRVERGAIYGGAAGLLFGDGLKGVVKGGIIGAGVGAVTGGGPEAREAQRSARRGALYGAGAGLVFGGGLDDALRGGVYGGAIGGALGRK